MWIYPDLDPMEEISGRIKTAGIILIIIGLIGIIFPSFLSAAVVIFIGWLMVIGGAVAGYFTYLTSPSEWLGWLKSLIPILIGALIITHPHVGTAAIGLLLAVYLFVDAFGSFSIAISLKPYKGWGLWLFNSAISFILALIFLIGWPFNSSWLVGLLIGISIFFEGVLLYLSSKFLEV